MSYIDIVFDGPPDHESGRFIEVEDSTGMSIRLGKWIKRENGYWALRIEANENDRAEAKLDAVKAYVSRLSISSDHPMEAWHRAQLLALLDERDALRNVDAPEPKRAIMPVDTSREAVEALIAECREVEGTNAWYETVANTLAALLDERDELRQALFDCYQASGADTDGANAREMASWKPYPRLVVEEVIRLRREADDDTEYDAQQQRIRDLEAEKHAAEQAAVGWRKEAERAETERDRLAAKIASERRWNRSELEQRLRELEAIRAWANSDLERAQPKYGEYAEGLLMAQEVVRAILADTNEGNE